MTKFALLIKFAPLIAMLTMAACTDIRARRIPNWLSFSMIITGLAQGFLPLHTVSPVQSGLGFAAGFGLMFLLFVLGAVGGGDVKMMAGVGAWVGPGAFLTIYMVNAVIGLIIVLCQAIYQGRLRSLMTNTTVLTINLVHLQDVGLAHAQATGRSCRSVDRPLPYAVPVLLAVLLVLARS